MTERKDGEAGGRTHHDCKCPNGPPREMRHADGWLYCGECHGRLGCYHDRPQFVAECPAPVAEARIPPGYGFRSSHTPEPRIVAECWTCGFSRAGAPPNTNDCRAAGHDVREIAPDAARKGERT